MRKQLLDGLVAGQVTDAIDLNTLPDHPAVVYGNTPATLADVASLLGLDSVPSPTATDPKTCSMKRSWKRHSPFRDSRDTPDSFR
jgi:hypothetical protein